MATALLIQHDELAAAIKAVIDSCTYRPDCVSCIGAHNRPCSEHLAQDLATAMRREQLVVLTDPLHTTTRIAG